MTKDEALKLALEALEVCEQSNYGRNWVWPDTARPTAMANVKEAITAIKEALSNCQCPECQVVLHASDCAVHNEPAYPKGECNCGAQPEQEPVAWMMPDGKTVDKWALQFYGGQVGKPLYTTSPQRTEQNFCPRCGKRNKDIHTCTPPQE